MVFHGIPARPDRHAPQSLPPTDLSPMSHLSYAEAVSAFRIPVSRPHNSAFCLRTDPDRTAAPIFRYPVGASLTPLTRQFLPIDTLMALQRVFIGSCFALLCAIVLPACSFSGGGPIRAQSVSTSTALELIPTIRGYRAIDKNTADVYLTDLPRAALERGADLSEVSGQILHLHLFISPEAGSTPIDSTACSVTLRLLVISRGQVGAYGGGGFIMPDSDPGEDDFDGSMDRATLRYVGGTPGFADRLGPSELSGAISAPRDDPTAAMIAAQLEHLMAATTKRPEPPKSR